jgi:hypothetical protein
MTTPVINHDSQTGELLTGMAMRMLVRVTVDGIARPMQDSTLTAQVVSRDHSRALTAAVALTNDAPANWSQGLVLVVLPSTETAKVLEDDIDILILEVDADGEKWGHFKQIYRRQGIPS